MAADLPQSPAPLRAAVFASGTGTNAENIIRTCKDLPHVDIALVITNKPGAGVIERARRLGIPCAVMPRAQDMPLLAAKAAQEAQILEALRQARVDWLFLAGFMQLLSADFLRHFEDAALGINRVVNIHPSLLPEFAGKDSYERAFAAGKPLHGVTLHYVDSGMDTGPVIAQATYPRTPDMTFEQFCASGQQLEYGLYSDFLRHLPRNHHPTTERTDGTAPDARTAH